MSLVDDSKWALDRSENLDDLRALWINVWHMWGEQAKCEPPAELVAYKNARKALHEGADTDKLLADLQHVLIRDSKHGKRDLEDWMRSVGWSTLRKAKAPGWQMPERVEKQVRAIIACGMVEDEALIDD